MGEPTTTDIMDAIAALRTHVDARIDRVEARIDRVEARIDRVEAQITQFERAVQVDFRAQGERIARVEGHLEAQSAILQVAIASRISRKPAA